MSVVYIHAACCVYTQHAACIHYSRVGVQHAGISPTDVRRGSSRPSSLKMAWFRRMFSSRSNSKADKSGSPDSSASPFGRVGAGSRSDSSVFEAQRMPYSKALSVTW